MNVRLALFLPAILLIAACGGSKKTQTASDASIDLDEIVVKAEKEYRPSHTMVNDLLHTSLNVSFDWEKQYLNGNAVLTLKPFARPVSSVELDAKGFDILKVERIDGTTRTPLTYEYDSLKLVIDLQQVYTPTDTYTIQIDYVAKPNELPEGGSSAISADKGLYFIDPLRKEKNKPMQIWTQGETEASSCWFPTIDKPNEKTTQEIYITVPDTLVTLSNGVLAKSTKNNDGTRTDYWKMVKPHAPYLFMMAVSDFAVVHDTWRGIEVDYYVEKEYGPYAKDIFGNTPEMMEFFSKLLGYDYPWEKYAQVVVRDYVSGAMENTTATVFFETLLMTKRELIDKNYEDIISHELFHQWFGDIVTCESWSNLTLNEAFATYGEYLWAEHKYGRDEAERQRREMLGSYLSESRRYKRPIIEFQYDDKEDMFDSHSYSKGGLVLHMLRTYLGDEIFFKGLNHYLKKHEYQSVEVHDLRIALEEVSGEDLNWFFNQWLLSAGHPQLDVSYSYSDSAKLLSVTVEQVQDSKYPVFRLPMRIDIYSGANVKNEDVVLEKKSQTFEFEVSGKPDLVNVDGEKYLLCVINDYKSVDEYAVQYDRAPGYMNKLEALEELADNQDKAVAKEKLLAAFSDPYWEFRRTAVQEIKLTDETKQLIVKAATGDKKSLVRSAAIWRLAETVDSAYLPLFENALNDSSLQVASEALDAIYALDEPAALRHAQKFEQFNAPAMMSLVCSIYGQSGGDEKLAYFEQKVYSTGGFTRIGVLSEYGDFLKGKKTETVREGVQILEDVAINAGTSFERFIAATAIHDLKRDATDETLIAELQAVFDRVIAAEKDEKLVKRYKNFK